MSTVATHKKNSPINGHALPDVPRDEQAEAGLVCSPVAFPHRFSEFLDITPRHFYLDTERVVWSVMQELHAEGATITPKAVHGKLAENDGAKMKLAGGQGAVTALFGKSDTGDNFDHWAKIVRQKHDLRELQRKFLDGANQISRGASLEDMATVAADLLTPRHAPGIEYQSLTLGDLKNVREPVYLIDGVLEMSQPGVIAGQWKSLKTTTAIELSYCLTTGHPFMGKVEPNRQARVGMFSGEAGPAQLHDTLRRVAAFHGDHDPWGHEGLIFSCEKLPKIGSPEYMDALVRWIGKHRLDLVIIDPGYAALAAIGKGAGNYYEVAELLFQVTELQRQTGCIMLLCPHMTKAPKYDPPMLSDIQWSGFPEWSGQWILMGKRREWDDQRGDHWLWMVTGGRSGHADTWGLDVHEGRKSDIGGKVFEVSVVDKGEAFSTSANAQQQQKERQASKELQAAEEAIRKAFDSLGDGPQVKAHVMERTGTSGRGKAMAEAWAAMLRKNEISTHQGACTTGKNTPCEGYSLRKSGG